ncbi:MAG: NADH:ubiquinone reductase (Na(+)-transporting) subunit A [Kangiellaceae bacterium]|jgi:Na+-transporting NADH:ubiquinone oxidoreductase subunit A|nr:NADH:ubiquinone reductase (Na(+)-transporting) subunit A [Kangiellaceae bacterium]|tara:strand:+ start:676 stop:2022 length:1347 start_codon:yes stop_codon:yes gene_type:complete
MIKIKKGLDLPISGNPEQTIYDGPPVSTVAILGEDYVGMKPTMKVQVGDVVKRGQPLFEDKKTPGVLFTSPAAGKVKDIHRGAKRALISVVIEVEGDDAVQFKAYQDSEIRDLSSQEIRDNLVQSGLWTALRTRPFSRIPSPQADAPKAIFVTAIDTNPLAADPNVIINHSAKAFNFGLSIIAKLTEGKTFLCTSENAKIAPPNIDNLVTESFSGPHPAGLPGTHIHYLSPVGKEDSVWYLGYQDVIAVGNLFLKGQLDPTRVISIAGPIAKKPRLVKTVLGANTDELTKGEFEHGDQRVVSGSVLFGHAAEGPRAYLGRYHRQISLLHEGREKEFFGWAKPGKDKFSVTRAYTSHLRGNAKFDMTTSTGGSSRAMVPIGVYERVMPLDLIPTPLLRSLIVEDTDTAQTLGCLELDEEDLALCTFVCPGKYDYGPILRNNLTKIEKEG